MGTFSFGGMHHQWHRNVRDRAEFQGYQLSWTEKVCLLSRGTLWCLWWLQPFFPEVVLEPCRLVTLQSLLGLDPQARPGEMPDPSHHLLIPGSRNLGVSKILSYGKDFSPPHTPVPHYIC